MSRQELSAALNLSAADMARECRAVFFWMRNSRNYKHLTDTGVWRAVQSHLTQRANDKAETKARAIREDWAGKTAADWKAFDAADRAAGWA